MRNFARNLFAKGKQSRGETFLKRRTGRDKDRKRKVYIRQRDKDKEEKKKRGKEEKRKGIYLAARVKEERRTK